MYESLGLPLHAMTATGRSRRRLLGIALGLSSPALAPIAKSAGVGAASVSSGAPKQHFPFGPVIPARPLPHWNVVTHEGQTSTLPTLLAGRVTALQLIFTGCSATCPLQGALFAQARQQLDMPPHKALFLSLSIDPLSDTPKALATWLQQFSREPGWLAAVPRARDLDAIFQVLGEGGEQRPAGRDPHTGQVYLIDQQGALAWRTVSMPPAQQIVSAIRALHQRG